MRWIIFLSSVYALVHRKPLTRRFHRVLVHFLGWSARHDRFISCFSDIPQHIVLTNQYSFLLF